VLLFTTEAVMRLIKLVLACGAACIIGMGALLLVGCSSDDGLGQKFPPDDIPADDYDKTPLPIAVDSRYVYAWTISRHHQCNATTSDETQVLMYQCIRVSAVQDPQLSSTYAAQNETLVQGSTRFTGININMGGASATAAQVIPELGGSWAYKMGIDLSNNPYAAMTLAAYHTQLSPRPQTALSDADELSFTTLNFFDVRKEHDPNWGGWDGDVARNFATDLNSYFYVRFGAGGFGTTWTSQAEYITSSFYHIGYAFQDTIQISGIDTDVIHGVTYKYEPNGVLRQMYEIIWPTDYDGDTDIKGWSAAAVPEPFDMEGSACLYDNSIVNILDSQADDLDYYWNSRCAI
jgi:hypothetical protein